MRRKLLWSRLISSRLVLEINSYRILSQNSTFIRSLQSHLVNELLCGDEIQTLSLASCTVEAQSTLASSEGSSYF